MQNHTFEDDYLMQIEIELALSANILSAVVSLIVAVFLARLWYRQENRIWTDLPLIFAITFFAMVANTTIQVLTMTGLVESSLEVFRIRTLTIGGSTLPLLAALLTIWLPRFEKHHERIMFLSVIYWILICFAGPTEVFIMTLLIPLLLAFSFGMLITFAITWKTGRLKEVRSDLMVLSLSLGFITQAFKMPMQAAGLDWFTVSIAGFTAVIAGIALYNPWFRRSLLKPAVSIDEIDYLTVA
jgi:hypothetical protein